MAARLRIKVRQRANGTWAVSLWKGREQLGHSTTVQAHGVPAELTPDEAKEHAKKIRELLWPGADIRVEPYRKPSP